MSGISGPNPLLSRVKTTTHTSFNEATKQDSANNISRFSQDTFKDRGVSGVDANRLLSIFLVDNQKDLTLENKKVVLATLKDDKVITIGKLREIAAEVVGQHRDDIIAAAQVAVRQVTTPSDDTASRETKVPAHSLENKSSSLDDAQPTDQALLHQASVQQAKITQEMANRNGSNAIGLSIDTSLAPQLPTIPLPVPVSIEPAKRPVSASRKSAERPVSASAKSASRKSASAKSAAPTVRSTQDQRIQELEDMVKSLRAELLAAQQTIVNVEREKTLAAHTNSKQTTQEINYLKTQVAQVEAENGQLTTQVAEQQAILKSQGQEIEQLRELVQGQKTTIAKQSSQLKVKEQVGAVFQILNDGSDEKIQRLRDALRLDVSDSDPDSGEDN